MLQTAFAADITGKITLKGTPPPEKTIPFDPTCGKLHTSPATTTFYTVGSDGAPFRPVTSDTAAKTRPSTAKIVPAAVVLTGAFAPAARSGEGDRGI